MTDGKTGKSTIQAYHTRAGHYLEIELCERPDGSVYIKTRLARAGQRRLDGSWPYEELTHEVGGGESPEESLLDRGYGLVGRRKTGENFDGPHIEEHLYRAQFHVPDHPSQTSYYLVQRVIEEGTTNYEDRVKPIPVAEAERWIAEMNMPLDLGAGRARIMRAPNPHDGEVL